MTIGMAGIPGEPGWQGAPPIPLRATHVAAGKAAARSGCAATAGTTAVMPQTAAGEGAAWLVPLRCGSLNPSPMPPTTALC